MDEAAIRLLGENRRKRNEVRATEAREKRRRERQTALDLCKIFDNITRVTNGFGALMSYNFIPQRFIFFFPLLNTNYINEVS